jgi:hypothetical protein
MCSQYYVIGLNLESKAKTSRRKAKIEAAAVYRIVSTQSGLNLIVFIFSAIVGEILPHDYC